MPLCKPRNIQSLPPSSEKSGKNTRRYLLPSKEGGAAFLFSIFMGALSWFSPGQTLRRERESWVWGEGAFYFSLPRTLYPPLLFLHYLLPFPSPLSLRLLFEAAVQISTGLALVFPLFCLFFFLFHLVWEYDEEEEGEGFHGSSAIDCFPGRGRTQCKV